MIDSARFMCPQYFYYWMQAADIVEQRWESLIAIWTHLHTSRDSTVLYAYPSNCKTHKKISESNGDHKLHSKVKVCMCILARYFRVLENTRKKYWPRQAPPHSPIQCSSYNQSQCLHVLHGKSRWPGACCTTLPAGNASSTFNTFWGMKPPASLTKLGFLLEICNLFRHFVADFARTMAPLNKKLQK